MKRRAFIGLIGGAAAIWPFRAQGNRPFRSSPSSTRARHPAGQPPLWLPSVRASAVEYRYSAGQDGKLAALVAELVHRPVAVLVGNTPPAVAAKTATSTIPIVFATGADPVKLGLVASFTVPAAMRQA
jgi:putative ABC transport system substrate-binding protein